MLNSVEHLLKCRVLGPICPRSGVGPRTLQFYKLDRCQRCELHNRWNWSVDAHTNSLWASNGWGVIKTREKTWRNTKKWKIFWKAGGVLCYLNNIHKDSRCHLFEMLLSVELGARPSRGPANFHSHQQEMIHVLLKRKQKPRKIRKISPGPADLKG